MDNQLENVEISAEEELANLKKALAESERRSNEHAIFKELFPGDDEKDLPDEVIGFAEEKALPLYAAYAVFRRKRERAAETAREKQLGNSMKSAGSLGGGAIPERLFSEEEIRTMTPQQVRRNYKQIIKSLRKTAQN